MVEVLSVVELLLLLAVWRFGALHLVAYFMHTEGEGVAMNHKGTGVSREPCVYLQCPQQAVGAMVAAAVITLSPEKYYCSAHQRTREGVE